MGGSPTLVDQILVPLVWVLKIAEISGGHRGVSTEYIQSALESRLRPRLLNLPSSSVFECLTTSLDVSSTVFDDMLETAAHFRAEYFVEVFNTFLTVTEDDGLRI